MEQSEWITPQEALRMAANLPRARDRITAWISDRRIELWSMEVVHWVDDEDAVPADVYAAYFADLKDYVRGMNRPGRVGQETIPEPRAPVPPLKRVAKSGQRVPVENMEGVNFGCSDFWDSAELAPKISGQSNPDAKAVFAGVRLLRADVEMQLELAGLEIISTRPTGIEVPFIETGTPGRPTGKLGVQIIFRERLASGLVFEKIADEAAFLAAAYRDDPRFPSTGGWPSMEVGTIENAIRAEYRAWKAAKATK